MKSPKNPSWLVALSVLTVFYVFLTWQAGSAVNTFWSRRGEFGFVGRKKFLTWFVVCGLLGWMFTRCVQAWLVGFAVYESTRKINLAMLIYESNAFLNVLSISVSGSFLGLRVWLTYFDCCLAAANSDSQWQNLIIQPVAYIPVVLARVNVELIQPERNTLGSGTAALDTTVTSTGFSKILRHLSLTGGSRGSQIGHKHSISASLNPFTPSSGGGNSQCSVHAAFSPKSTSTIRLINHGASAAHRRKSAPDLPKSASSSAAQQKRSKQKSKSSKSNKSIIKSQTNHGFSPKSSAVMAPGLASKDDAALNTAASVIEVSSSLASPTVSPKVSTIGAASVRRGHDTVHSEDLEQMISTVERDWFFINRYTWGNHQWFYRKLLLFLLLHTLFVGGTFMVPGRPELSLIGLSIYVVEGSIFTLFIGKLASRFPRFNDSLKMISELHLLFALTLVSTLLMLLSIVFIFANTGQSWNLHRRIDKNLEKDPSLFFWFTFAMNAVFIGLAYLCILVQTLWVCLTFPNSGWSSTSSSKGGRGWRRPGRVIPLRKHGNAKGIGNRSHKVTVRDIHLGHVLMYSWFGQCLEWCGFYNWCCNRYSVSVCDDQNDLSMPGNNNNNHNNKPVLNNILASLGLEAAYITGGNASNQGMDPDLDDMDGGVDGNGEPAEITLADVLRDELGFRRFMSYLFSEFSYENLLCLIEVQQFVRLCQYEETMDLPAQMSIISLSEDREIEPGPEDVKHLPPVLDLTTKILDLAPSVTEVQSSIVSYESMNKEQKFLVLYQKYIADDSEMPVNISFRTRQDLREVASFLLRGTLPSRMVTKDVFDGLISELIYLMRDSLSRFKYTSDFIEVKRSIHQSQQNQGLNNG